MPALPDDPFAAVRSSCARVAARAALVTIDPDRLVSYAVEVAALPPPVHDDPARRAHGDVDTTVAFVLALDAVNFGSGWFPLLDKPPGVSGYHLVASALERAEPVTASWLAAATPAAVAALLGQEGNAAAAPFVAEVAGALADLGTVLDGYGGSAAALVAAADGSAARLAHRLWAMPRYRDVADDEGGPVWFLKRAQITAADLAAALPGHHLGTFADLDQLTVFADNLLPHVLRTDGVIRYAPALAALVDGRVELAAGGPEEVEVRAVTVHAAEQLRAAVGERLGRAVTAPELDWWLWTRGQDARYRRAPRHRTRTTAY